MGWCFGRCVDGSHRDYANEGMEGDSGGHGSTRQL